MPDVETNKSQALHFLAPSWKDQNNFATKNESKSCNLQVEKSKQKIYIALV